MRSDFRAKKQSALQEERERFMRRYVGYGYGYYRCYFASGLFACP